MSHPGDDFRAVQALEALQTHLLLPADDERHFTVSARRVLATTRPYSIFKVKKSHFPRAPVCFPAGRMSQGAISSSTEISKGESGLIKMGAVSPLGPHQISGRPFIETLFVITPN